MANNIRFVDSLKVGAYNTQNTGGSGITINNNIDNYVLTATGNQEIDGNANLQFDGVNLGIGGPSNGARFEINDNTSNDLLLIKNSSNQGIKIKNSGVLQLLEFSSLPTAVEGGIVFSSNEFFLGY
jgi:hypothetical protein